MILAWIRCADRLPPDDETVNYLFYDGRAIYLGYRTVTGLGAGWTDGEEHWKDDSEVTHWMALPEPPV